MLDDLWPKSLRKHDVRRQGNIIRIVCVRRCHDECGRNCVPAVGCICPAAQPPSGRLLVFLKSVYELLDRRVLYREPFQILIVRYHF